MDSSSPTPPRIERQDARREHAPYGPSLLRFLGLSAAGGFLGRTVLATRSRRVLAAVLVAGAVTGGALLLLSNSTENTVYQHGTAVGPTHVPGGSADASAIGAGGASVDVTKVYPRIYSPKLGIDIEIKQGDGSTPPVAPIAFLYPHTAPIGQPGNTYLYAHDRAGMFLGLHQAQVGDVVIVAESATQKLYYQVTEIHANVAWNDFEWLRPSHDSRLTLQTCNYSGDFDPRFIVVTQPISTDQGKALTGGV